MSAGYYSSDKYEPRSVAALWFHTDDCTHYTAALDNAYHIPAEKCSPRLVIVLPHQCDAWAIGAIDDVKALIVDLRALIGVTR